jgi:hypothetical protein
MAAQRSLTELLQPARERGTELEAEIMKLFTAFNVYTGDQTKLTGQIFVWAEELEEFPLYAIRKAYKSAVRAYEKLPPMASFVRDVRAAIGHGVLSANGSWC